MIRSILIVVFASIVIVPLIQAADNAEHQERLAKHYRLEKPEGMGPFPAVMMPATGGKSSVVAGKT